MHRALIRVLASALLLAGGSAQAADCSIVAAAIAFGSYASGDPVALDTQGGIQIDCSGAVGENVGYAIALGAGSGASGYLPRSLTGTSGSVQYNLYTDPARAEIWGDGSATTALVSGTLAMPGGTGSRNLPVYGRVFGSQAVFPGSYSDLVVITLSF